MGASVGVVEKLGGRPSLEVPRRVAGELERKKFSRVVEELGRFASGLQDIRFLSARNNGFDPSQATRANMERDSALILVKNTLGGAGFTSLLFEETKVWIWNVAFEKADVSLQVIDDKLRKGLAVNFANDAVLAAGIILVSDLPFQEKEVHRRYAMNNMESWKEGRVPLYLVFGGQIDMKEHAAASRRK